MSRTGLDVNVSAGLLAQGSMADICRELNLSENADGLMINQSGELVLFPVGAFLPWQRNGAAIDYIWLGGGPLTLSYSPDGHDAGAVHLGPDKMQHHQPSYQLAADIWHTAESLGAWSLLKGAFAAGQYRVERAAEDWFPTPRPAKNGG